MVAEPDIAAGFSKTMERLGVDRGDPIAVAVSGGADSMALAHLLGQWSAGELHILTVDHGLRVEARDEARLVARFAKSIGAKYKKFKWMNRKSDKSIQENARAARYQMMADYCLLKSIPYLLTAHHADDQTETVLFRLAKGSGLDGLRGIEEKSAYDRNVNLLRPLLHVTHEDCVALCRREDVAWAEDPSNQSEKYMRGRMRASRAVLEREGLTAERVEQLTRRIDRALNFIEYAVDEYQKKLILISESNRIVFKWSEFGAAPDEVIVRLLQRTIARLGASTAYGPRLEDVERLAARMTDGNTFRGATLGKVKISVSRRRDELVFAPEDQ